MSDQADNSTSRDAQGWHYERDGKTVGPFSGQELVSLAKAGLIGPKTILVRPDGKRLAADQVLKYKPPSKPGQATVPATASAPDEQKATVAQAAVVGKPAAAPAAIPLPPPPPDAPCPGPLPPPSDAPSAGLPSAEPASQSAALLPQPADAKRLAAWTRLRVLARWQQWLITLVCVGGIALVALANGLVIISGFRATVWVIGPLSCLVVTALWACSESSPASTSSSSCLCSASGPL